MSFATERRQDVANALRGPTVALSVVALAATVWLLNFAEDVLIPLAVAILVWAIINSLAAGFRRLHVGDIRAPHWLSLTFAVAIVLAALYGVGGIISNSAQLMARNAPAYQANVERLLANLAERFGMELDLSQLLEQINFGSVLSDTALMLSALIGNAAVILVFVIFLMVEQSTFDMKIETLFKDPKRQREIKALFDTLAKRIQDYLRVKTIMSVLTGGVSYGVLRYLEVDFAAFWAFLIFLLNYVPTIGSTLGVVFPAIQVLVQFGDPVLFFIVVAVLGLIPQFIIGNIIEPKVMGVSLNLSPIVILFSLAFWGIIWGIAGLFLSVPIMVIIMIICAHFEPSRWLAILLSGDGQIVEYVRAERKEATF